MKINQEESSKNMAALPYHSKFIVMGIHLFDKYFRVTGTTLGTGDAAVETKQSSYPYGAAILMSTIIVSES